MTLRLWIIALLCVGNVSEAAPSAAADEAQPVSTAPSSRPVSDSPSELLQQAMDLYLEGQYQQAADQLRPLVEGRRFSDRADHKEALRAYGISLYLSGGVTGAELAFRNLLRLDPAARLDPAFVRPEVVRFFEQVRFKSRLEVSAIVRKHGPQGSAAVNLLPPWGQFNNGHRVKAYTVLGGELLFTAASITSAALLFSWQGDTREFKGQEDAYPALKTINTVSFIALATVIVYGVVDGLYYYYSAPKVDEKQKVGATDRTAWFSSSPLHITF